MPAPQRAFAEPSTHDSDARAEAKRRVRVRYHYDPNADESAAWSATTRDGPPLHATARDYTRLRRSMRALVRRANGRRTKLLPEFQLPEPLNTELSDYQRDLHFVRTLEQRLRGTRMPLAYRILELRLAQADVAALLEITPGRFGALLQADVERSRVSQSDHTLDDATTEPESLRDVAE